MLDHPLTTEGAAKFKADWETRPEFAEWLTGLVEARAAAQRAEPADRSTEAARRRATASMPTTRRASADLAPRGRGQAIEGYRSSAART